MRRTVTRVRGLRSSILLLIFCATRPVSSGLSVTAWPGSIDTATVSGALTRASAVAGCDYFGSGGVEAQAARSTRSALQSAVCARGRTAFTGDPWLLDVTGSML